MHKLTLYIIIGILLLAIFSACGEEAPMSRKLYPFWKGRSYGYINERGATRVPLQFAYSMPFEQNLGAVNIGGTPKGRDMPNNGKWGFVNREGQFVINPNYFPPITVAAPYNNMQLSKVMHEGYIFSEGLAAVVDEERNWIYINQEDSIVIRGARIPFERRIDDSDTLLRVIESARRFSEGLAAVYIDGYWGYIDTFGYLKIDPIFLFPVNFHEGYAIVMDKDLNYICINRKGERVFSQYRIETSFNHKVATIKEGFRRPGDVLETDDLKMGLMDIEGHVIVAPQFDKVRRFAEELAPVLIGSEQLGSLVYQNDIEARDFKGGKWGYIDTHGVIRINPTFDEACQFSGGLAAVRKGRLWGYINRAGRYIFPPSFQRAAKFEGEIAVVTLGPEHGSYEGKLAYLNKGNKSLVWIAP